MQQRTHTRRFPQSVPAVISAAALLAPGACGPRAGGSAAPDLTNPAEAATAAAALLPTRLIIHPLTRIGSDPQGRPALLAHIELRDRFDQNTRALGVLHVSVQKPGLDTIMAAADPSVTSPGELAWEIDLRDPDRNALLYDDLITRTYSLTLTGLPAWLVAWSEGRDTALIGAGAPTVVASFSFPDPRAPGRTAKAVSDTARLLR